MVYNKETLYQGVVGIFLSRTGWLLKKFIARFFLKVEKSTFLTTALFLQTTMARSAR